MGVLLLKLSLPVQLRKKKPGQEGEKKKKDDIWFDDVDPFDIEKTVPDFELTDKTTVVKSATDPTKEIVLKDDDK